MRVKGILSYDGSSFHGYAINSDVRTVAGELDSALTKVLGERVVVTCAGRTDRGVHAQGQVISFDTPQGTDLGKLQNSINRICRPHPYTYTHIDTLALEGKGHELVPKNGDISSYIIY